MVGLAGQFGLPVVDHVEAEVPPEDEHVPHLHPPTVGLTVQGRVMRGKLARFRTAVSKAERHIVEAEVSRFPSIVTTKYFSQSHTKINVMD